MCISAVVVSSFSSIAKAATYYVDASSTCSSCNGSQSRPFRTIQEGADAADSPGDTVIIKNGTYPERVTIRYSGSSGNYITFTSENPTRPHKDFSEFSPNDRPHISGPNSDSCSDNGLIHIYEENYLKFIGLEISRMNCYSSSNYAYDIRVISGSNLIFQYLDLHHPGGSSHALEVYGTSENIQIIDNTVHHVRSAAAIDIAQNHSKTEDGRPKYVTIARNWIYNINPDYQSGIGAAIATERMDYAYVYDNEVYYSRMGLDIGCGKENKIYNNRLIEVGTGIGISGNQYSIIHDNYIKIADGGDEGMLSYDHYDDYGVGERHVGNKWYRNFVTNAWRPFREYNKDPGNWPSAESLHQIVFNNIFTNSRSFVELTNVSDFMFFNNTVYGSSIVADSVGMIRNNIIINGSINSSAPQSNNITSSTGIDIINPGGNSARDYRIESTSVAKDSGTVISQQIPEQSVPFGERVNGSSIPSDLLTYTDLLKDFEGKERGTSWDVGAYEVAGDDWSSPPAPPEGLRIVGYE